MRCRRPFLELWKAKRRDSKRARTARHLRAADVAGPVVYIHAVARVATFQIGRDQQESVHTGVEDPRSALIAFAVCSLLGIQAVQFLQTLHLLRRYIQAEECCPLYHQMSQSRAFWMK